MTIAKTLSLAFVMIAGPQILAAIFLATTKKWWQNSLAFVAGAGVSVTVVATIGFLLSLGASNHGSRNGLLIVILVLLVFAAIHKFLTRKQSQPPKWMGRLEEAQPKGAFKLGFLLLGAFPSDILTGLAVGGFASAQHSSWLTILPFVGLTLLLLGLPLILILLFRKPAEKFLPKARDWMNANSWIVSEIVLALFMAIVINDIVG